MTEMFLRPTRTSTALNVQACPTKSMTKNKNLYYEKTYFLVETQNVKL